MKKNPTASPPPQALRPSTASGAAAAPRASPAAKRRRVIVVVSIVAPWWLARNQDRAILPGPLSTRQSGSRSRLHDPTPTRIDAENHRTAPAARPRRRGAARRPSSRGCGIADADLRAFTVFKRSYDARKKSAIVLIYTVDCELRRRSRPCCRASPATRTCAPSARHALPLRRPRAGRLPRRRSAAPAGDRLRPLRHLRGADAGADGPAADRARARQGGARAHQGHLGPVAQGRARTPSRTCSSAKAAPAPSPTASCRARSATRATSRARC